MHYNTSNIQYVLPVCCHTLQNENQRQTNRQAGENLKASFNDVNCNQGATYKIQYKSKQHKGRQQKVQNTTTKWCTNQKTQGIKQRLWELAKEQRMELLLMLLMVGNNGFEQIIPQHSTATTKEQRFTVAPLNVFFSGYLKGPVWKIICE